MPDTLAPGASNVHAVVPFLWVRDLPATLRFYVDGLGFTRTREWVDDGRLRWCLLELGGAAVMLQEFWKDGPHQNQPATPVGVGLSLMFMCRDALALYHEFRARGLTPGRPFVGNGLWVVQLADPDGYQVCFESPTTEPEETVYQGGR
jgi:catechol 2,3-dioxygenase-like lactoylglutathione lyase family enzyme